MQYLCDVSLVLVNNAVVNTIQLCDGETSTWPKFVNLVYLLVPADAIEAQEVSKAIEA